MTLSSLVYIIKVSMKWNKKEEAKRSSGIFLNLMKNVTAFRSMRLNGICP